MTSKLKLKKLEEYLGFVETFEHPKILLEQYQTPAHIASVWLFTAHNNYNDIDKKLTADIGCGTGILALGAALLGSNQTVAFDIDSEALEIAKSNVSEMEINTIDFVQCDVVSEIEMEKWCNVFDTVFMNPPFGTKKNAGMDMKFLKIAIKISRNVVYSLHKSSTRAYIEKKTKELNVKGTVIAELKYNIDSSYRFHKKQSVDIAVDVWRFVVNK